jgi:hypothetical protein
MVSPIGKGLRWNPEWGYWLCPKVPSDGPCKLCRSDQSDPREIGVSGGLAQGDVGSVDSPKVASRSAAAELGRLLESPEITKLIAELEATRWTGS